MTKTTIIIAHPNFGRSRANGALAAAAWEARGVELVDLYALYPGGKIDVEAEIARLLQADRLVLQFPMQWYSTPSLLKEWLDQVLTVMFYFRPELGLRLNGMPLTVAMTMGGTEGDYQPAGRNGISAEELLRPLETVARRGGFDWQEPLLVYNAREASDDELAAAAATYRNRLEANAVALAA